MKILYSCNGRIYNQYDWVGIKYGKGIDWGKVHKIEVVKKHEVVVMPEYYGQEDAVMAKV